MARLLAVDPGLTSGVVVLLDGEVESFAEVLFAEVSDVLGPLVIGSDEIVVERFTIGPRTLSLSRQPEALYVIGWLLVEGQRLSKRVELQNPADAMQAFSDDVLRELGMFNTVRGRHARDALRHGLLHLRRSGIEVQHGV